jgi:hypothetical protein
MINDTMVKATPTGKGTVDDPVILNISIMNPSNFGTGPFMVFAVIDNNIDNMTTFYEGPYSLEAASKMYIERSIVFSDRGDYLIIVEVDISDQVVEYNETNNAASTIFSVKPRTVLNWSVDPSEGTVTIAEGASAIFSASAEREGKVLTGEWYLDGSNVGTGGTFDFDASYVGENSSEGSPFTIVYALDGGQTFGDEQDNATWILEITDVDRPPVVESLSPAQGNLTISEGSYAVFRVLGSDPDGDALSYNWSLDGMNIADGPEYNFTSDFLGGRSSVGSPYNISLTLNSRSSSIERYWNVHVLDVDRPFTLLTSPEGTNLTMLSGGNITFVANYSDPDGDEPHVSWAFLGGMTNASYTLTLFADELGLTSNVTFPVTLTVSSGIFSANRTWSVQFILVPIVDPPEKIPPKNVTIISPPPGYIFRTGSIVTLQGAHDDLRKVNFTWTLNAGTYYGQTVNVSGLLPGNYTATLNASVVYPAPAWTERTVRFSVVDQEIEVPPTDDDDRLEIWVLLVIAFVLAVSISLSLFLAAKWLRPKASAATPTEDAGYWEE